jgi:glyoxylase-like metal-dependent hydrolase (beta-lactamase superfamily II)
MHITSRIHAIKISFAIPVAPGKTLARFVYCYLVSGREKTCLIDSGVSGAEGVIFENLAKIEKDVESLGLLVLTHSHPDHIGSAPAVRKTSGCLTAAHPAARAWIEDTEKQFRERPVPGFHTLVAGPVPIDRDLAEGERIDLGGISLQVLFTPGHSSCSVSLFCEEDGVLFTGDAVPETGGLPIYEDPAASATSLRKLRGLKNIRHLLSSWSEPRQDSDAYARIDEGLAYFKRLHGMVRQIQEEIPGTDYLDLCRRMVQGLGLPPIAVNPLVARSFGSHLPYLENEEL